MKFGLIEFFIAILLFGAAFALPDYLASLSLHHVTSHDFSVLVRTFNNGTDANSTSLTRISINGVGFNLQVPALHEDESRPAIVGTACSPGQEITVGASADSTNLISESNEANNGAALSFACLNATQVPDLIIANISAPRFGVAGRSLTIRTTTKNIGAFGSLPSITRLMQGNITVANANVPPLLPGGSTQQVFWWACPAPGSFYLSAVADATNTNYELNEENNQVTFRIACVGPMNKTNMNYTD